jgi:Predicted AAA-ATPase
MDGKVCQSLCVFLRPGRFGKRTNLSMLHSFFSFGAELKDFNRFLIGKEIEFMKEHCGKYPVAMMNMKDIDGDNWEQMLSRIWSSLRATIIDQEENLNKLDVKFIGVDCYDASGQPSESIAAAFLKHLTSHLQSISSAYINLFHSSSYSTIDFIVRVLLSDLGSNL